MTHNIQTQLLSESSCCIHGPTNHSHVIPGVISSLSTPLHDLLKPAPSPCAPSSIFGGFFGG
ncbi:hypothetical protein B0H14DRAFT_3495665 [Mycena olivaceomarginata]|nr:hypothetical protein B0H14DRAFT_3495665 [Mycena olivaceomarginata]